MSNNLGDPKREFPRLLLTASSISLPGPISCNTRTACLLTRQRRFPHRLFLLELVFRPLKESSRADNHPHDRSKNKSIGHRVTIGAPRWAGAYFAANFAQLLGRDSKSFTVLSRVDAHRYLVENHWTDCDLARPEILQKFVDALDVDALLAGNVQSEKNYFHIDLILRDVSGKARIHCVYEELFRPYTVGCFPASTSSSGWPFYFPMLDGVTLPKAVKTPTYPYPASYKPVLLAGTVVISIVVTTDGNAEQARVVQRVDPDFDSDALTAVKAWHFEPAKSPDGTPVPTRLVLLLRFNLKGLPVQAQYPEDQLHP